MFVSGSFDKSVVGIFEPFKLTLNVTVPNYAVFNISIDIIGPVTTTAYTRLKVCSSSIVYAGDNLPCLDCLLNDASYTTYSINPLVEFDYDSFTLNNIQIFNNGLRSTADYPNANTLR